MRNILAENERQNNARGSGISVSASSSGPRYSRSQSRYNVDLRQGLVDDSYFGMTTQTYRQKTDTGGIKF